MFRRGLRAQRGARARAPRCRSAGLDLDRALGRDPLDDARRNAFSASRRGRGTAVATQRDHQAAAVASILSGSTSAARASTQFVQPRRLVPRGRSSDRLSLRAARRARALRRHDSQAHVSSPLVAATRSSPRSSITTRSVRLEQHEPRSAIIRRAHNSEPASIWRDYVSIVSARSPGGAPRPGSERAAPRRQLRRQAAIPTECAAAGASAGFDLDRAQSWSARLDDLAARPSAPGSNTAS